ncbi:hypothetical protein BCR44DRAFT_1431042 [Catenaria anguillulae PL171]|uniref:BAH domain-containing protein n=1 Tax=Catenaria anguillulae PL171 TaxID=765915 RepID=A0A1Y2HS00_9FUNG|nr:hypothetical protein BCR44DRAFT_1431042 [Catenaria anguillulae PL171]
MASASTRRSSRLKASAASTSSSKPPRPEYKVDDCVMLRSDTLGEPYFLGRIMSFPDPTHVRIAWFYRPQDVLSKTKAYPPRLLVASMHSDINPLRSIVAKCTIKHVAEIGTGSDADLAAYVQQDHTFYYAQLFDRFTKRVYDVVPTHTVTNRRPRCWPKSSSFPTSWSRRARTRNSRPRTKNAACAASGCPRTTPSNVSSATACIMPRALPNARTARRRTTNEQAASDQLQDPYLDGDIHQVLALDDSRPSSPPTTGSRPRTSSNTFPWTYFGIHCTNTDAAELDPRHPFYPRIASRIASKYQATIPKLTVAGAGDSSSGRGGRNSLSGGAGVSAAGAKGKKKQAGAAADPAGTLRHVSLAHTGLPKARVWSTDELFSQLTTLDKPLALPAHSTALLDRAMFELHHSGYSVPATLSILTQLDATHILSAPTPESTPWTDQDNATFVDAVKLHGFDLQAIHEKCMPQRSMPTLQALAVFLHDVVGVSSPTMALEGMFESQMAGRGTGSRIKSPEPSASGGADLMSSDSEPEDIEATQCTLCKGTSASGRYVLTNGPQTVTHANLGVANPDACHVLCDTCGRYWMMYGGLRPAQVGEDGGYQDAMDVDEDEAGGRKKTAAAAPRRTRKRQANDGEDLSELSDVDDASATTQQQQPAGKEAQGKHGRNCRRGGSAHQKGGRGLGATCPDTHCRACACTRCRRAGNVPHVPRRRRHTSQVRRLRPVRPRHLLLPRAASQLCALDTARIHHVATRPRPHVRLRSDHPAAGLNFVCGRRRHHVPNAQMALRSVRERASSHGFARHAMLLCPHEFPCTPAQPMKRTAKRNWVHAMCALFVPEVKVGSADSLEPISGIDEIPKFRWESLCSICTVPGGVTVSCAEQGCGKEFHVSCAFRAGCYFGLLEQHVPSTAGRTKTVSVPNVWCRQHVISDANVDPACKAALMHAAGVAAAGTSGKGGKKSGGKAAQQQQQALIPHGLHVLEEGGDPFPPGDIDWRTKKGERMEIISRPVMRAVLDYAIHHKRAAPAATSRRRNYPILTGIQPSMAAPPTASVNAARAVISGLHAQQQHMQEQQHDDQSDPGQGAGGLKIKLKLGGGATPASGAPRPKCSSCLQRTSPVWWPAEVVLAQVDGHLKNGDAHIVRLAADATAPRLCMACFART